MPTTVRSAPSRRRIEMVAQRLSIWGALRQISSMNAKNTALRRGDWWVAFSSHQAAAAARKDAYDRQQRGSEGAGHRASPSACQSPGTSPPLLLPRHVVGTERNLHIGLWHSREKLIDWPMIFLAFKKQASGFQIGIFPLHQELLKQESLHFSLLFEESIAKLAR